MSRILALGRGGIGCQELRKIMVMVKMWGDRGAAVDGLRFDGRVNRMVILLQRLRKTLKGAAILEVS
jgi:hypothetical protein